MMKCGNCGFNALDLVTTTIEEWDGQELVVIQDIPVEKCPQCGEEYFAPDVLRQLETIMALRHTSEELQPAEILQVPVIKYVLT
jgi:YgiT-type zinc finger domain-containing protein